MKHVYLAAALVEVFCFGALLGGLGFPTFFTPVDYFILFAQLYTPQCISRYIGKKRLKTLMPSWSNIGKLIRGKLRTVLVHV